jgi:hypothetical protein
MAESQEFAVLTPGLVDAMEQAISLPRFAAYDGYGDREYALRLYLWNARLAKAFLFPLQICEVSTRNAVNEALAGIYGPNWILAPPFGLNDFSEASHTRALERLHRRADRRALPPPGSDDLVAALTFDFWSNLFRDDYDDVWTGPVLATAFPNLPVGEGRRDVQRRAAEVNELRNRIAHHEPIHDRQNHGAKLAAILDLIGLRSRPTRDFTRGHSTVMAVARVPPTRQSRFPGRPLAQMNLRPPPMLALGDPLNAALAAMRAARPELALIPGAGAPPFAALTTSSATALVIERAALASGLVDLSELTAGDVTTAHPLELGEIDLRASSGDVLSLFFPPDQTAPKPSALVVWSAQRVLTGVIVRPDLRL